MSSSGQSKLHLRHPVVVDVRCCLKPKLSSFFSSHSGKPKHVVNPFSTTTSASSTTYSSSSRDRSCAAPSSCEKTTSTPTPDQPMRRRRRKKRGKAGRAARESVVMVKETAEPYADFKESMVQMIAEKEMYGWDDLNDLLHQFLTLNSPRHHHVILRAFADLWNGVFSPPSPLAAADVYTSTCPPPF